MISRAGAAMALHLWSARAGARTVLLAALVLGAGRASASELELLLQDAYFHEVTLNDASRAVELYDRILAIAGIDPAVAATAHLRKGLCLEKQGRLEEAEAQYVIVLDRFSQQADAARVAAARLNIRPRRDPARYMPPDTLAYAELVDFEEQVEFLSELLRGTPLENPVDYYLSLESSAEAETGPNPASTRNSAIQNLRALLNLGFLREFKKIEGLALGISHEPGNAPEFLGVFVPGTSDLSRGVIKALLTLSVREIEERLESMTVFLMRDGSEDFYVAMDSDEEAVFFGTSLPLVRGAILRYRGDGTTQSLADTAEFRRALSARAGSTLFAYVDTRRLGIALREEIGERDQADFDLFSTLVGLEQMRSASVTFSRSGESFRFALRGRIDATEAPWTMTRTSLLDPECLELVPTSSPAFLAMTIDGVDRRLDTLGMLLQERFPDHLRLVPPGLRRLLNPPDDNLGRDDPTGHDLRAARRALARLRNVVWTLPPAPMDTDGTGYLVLGFGPGEPVRGDFESLLRIVLGSLYRNRASQEIRDAFEDLSLAGVDARLRVVEPAPGRFVGFATVPTTSESGNEIVVVAPRAGTPGEVFDRKSGVEIGVSPKRLPVAACKVLSIGPYLLPEPPTRRRRPQPLEVLLSRMPVVVVHTLESREGISLEITVPEARRFLRDALAILHAQSSGDGTRSREED